MPEMPDTMYAFNNYLAWPGRDLVQQAVVMGMIVGAGYALFRLIFNIVGR